MDRPLPLLPGCPPPMQPRKASATGLESILRTFWPPVETTTEVVWGKELVWPVVRSPQTSALLWGSHSRLATILTCQGKVRPPGSQAALTSSLAEALGRQSSPPVTWTLVPRPGVQARLPGPSHAAAQMRGWQAAGEVASSGRAGGPGPVTPACALLLTRASGTPLRAPGFPAKKWCWGARRRQSRGAVQLLPDSVVLG